MFLTQGNQPLVKNSITAVQVNLGNRCNQACAHCHVDASPHGDKNMDAETAQRVLEKLLAMNVQRVEFTGGAPEMNPHLAIFLHELGGRGRDTVVRSNLTVLEMPEYAHCVDLFRRCGTKVIASLPGCFRETTDRQRGSGVFHKSLAALRRLNQAGYGSGTLRLDLAYNPSGDYLPPAEEDLTKDFRLILTAQHGIRFDNLIAMTNAPVGRFYKHLVAEGRYDAYLKLLVNNFNSATLDRVMCRELIVVDYRGYVYDCDFNQALGIRVKGYEEIPFWDIDFEGFHPTVSCDVHCYACTVNRGSSCSGSLLGKERSPVQETVKAYYGTELTGTRDLKTNVCCTVETLPPRIRDTLPFIAEEIKERYYGCGSPIPELVEGLQVLDIGCGTGRDCYVLSRLVGQTGFVHGIDMTDSQIAVARKYLPEQMERFGYDRINVRFIHDLIENVGSHFPEESLDLVVSNCVVNLVEDKQSLVQEVFRLLRQGGEFYFSDIYADRRVPPELRADRVLYGECLGGALYWKDFERMARRAGFTDPRVVSKKRVNIDNEDIKALIGNIGFYSITYRLWKIDGLEDACEDYGHVAVYRGGIPEAPFSIPLDGAHVFEKGKPERVCGNTALMLSRTRLGRHFDVIGSFDTHYGLFEACGTPARQESGEKNSGGCSC